MFWIEQRPGTWWCKRLQGKNIWQLRRLRFDRFHVVRRYGDDIVLWEKTRRKSITGAGCAAAIRVKSQRELAHAVRPPRVSPALALVLPAIIWSLRPLFCKENRNG